MNSLCHYCSNCIDTKNPCTKVKDKIMWCKDFILHDPLDRGNKKDIWPTAKWIFSHRNGFGNAIGYCSNCNVWTEKTNYCHNCGYKFKEEKNMPRINLNFEIEPLEAFNMLCQALHVGLKDNIDESDFVIEDGEIVVKDYDDRGELYMALYHLATKICGNTEFRSIFDNPNTLMTELYKKKEETKFEPFSTVAPIISDKINKYHGILDVNTGELTIFNKE